MFPILEYEAPKAFYLGQVAKLFTDEDERLHPSQNTEQYLREYISKRGKPLSTDEFSEMIEHHRKYGSNTFVKALVYDWNKHYPEDETALWHLANIERVDGRVPSSLMRAEALLSKHPNNPKYLVLAADLELTHHREASLSFSQKVPIKALEYLQRVLTIDGVRIESIREKIAEVYAASGQTKKALDEISSLIEQAPLGEKMRLSMRAAFWAFEGNEWSEVKKYTSEILKMVPDYTPAQDLLQRATLMKS